MIGDALAAFAMIANGACVGVIAGDGVCGRDGFAESRDGVAVLVGARVVVVGALDDLFGVAEALNTDPIARTRVVVVAGQSVVHGHFATVACGWIAEGGHAWVGGLACG